MKLLSHGILTILGRSRHHNTMETMDASNVNTYSLYSNSRLNAVTRMTELYLSSIRDKASNKIGVIKENIPIITGIAMSRMMSSSSICIYD